MCYFKHILQLPCAYSGTITNCTCGYIIYVCMVLAFGPFPSEHYTLYMEVEHIL